jgi:hypothetical protein
MGFKSDADKEAFKQKLKAAGFDDAEIDTEVRNIDGPPTPTTEFMGGAQATTAQPSAESLAAENQRALTAQRKEAEAQGNTALGAMKDLTGIAVTDAGKAALAIPAAYGAYELTKKGYTSIKDRFFNKEGSLAETQRQSEAVKTIPETVTGEKPPAKMSATDRELWNKYAEQQAAKMTFGGNMAPQAQPGVLPSMTTPQPTAAPVAPTVAAPVAPPAPVVQNVAQTVSPPEAGSPLPNPTEPAAEKAAAVAKKPVAPPSEGLSKQEAGMKKHLISLYGGGPEAEAAYGKVKEILGYTPAYPPGKGGSLNPEEKGKVLTYRKENIPGPKINLTHDMKKMLAKGAGGAAILAAIPEFANAAQAAKEGNTTPAKETLFNLLTGLNLPLSLFTQASGLSEGEAEELAKRRYAAQVGAGRGIAPPQAYQR